VSVWSLSIELGVAAARYRPVPASTSMTLHVRMSDWSQPSIIRESSLRRRSPDGYVFQAFEKRTMTHLYHGTLFQAFEKSVKILGTQLDYW
jgi:hypothetical protein